MIALAPLLEVVGPLAGVLVGYISAAKLRRSDRAALKGAAESVVKSMPDSAPKFAGMEDTEVLQQVLDADEIKMIVLLPQGVGLDVSQISSRTELSPSEAAMVLNGLVTKGLVESSIQEVAGVERFRKLIPDGALGVAE